MLGPLRPHSLYSAQPVPRRQYACTQSLARRLLAHSISYYTARIPHRIALSRVYGCTTIPLHYSTRMCYHPDATYRMLPTSGCITPGSTVIISQYISLLLLPQASIHPYCAPREAPKAPIDTALPVDKGLSTQEAVQRLWELEVTRTHKNWNLTPG